MTDGKTRSRKPPRPTPHPARLDPGLPEYALIMERHDAAVARGDGLYVDPGSGLFVMTAQALWDRGTCCDTGCRHCPYA